MDDSTHPEARLRAADPAGPDPDLSALQARVLGELAARAAEEPARGGSAWPRLMAAAGAVIALGAAGLAGYAIGQGPSDPAIVASSVDAAAPSFGPSPGPAAPSAGPSAGPSAEKAADAPASEPPALAPAPEQPSAMSMPWPGWTTAWQAAPALPDAPSVATGYALSSADLDRAALAGELASALAVTGDVEPDGAGGYRAGSIDGSGPSLGVGGDAMATWSYFDPAVQPAAEAAPIDPDAAQRQARALLRSVGVPVRDVEWQVEANGPLTAVTAWQVVSGVRTQLQWSVLVAPDGSIASASGFAAGLVPIPGYEVVGAATAVRRIAEPGWNALAPAPLAGAPVIAPSAPAEPVPVPSANGRPVVTATVAFVTVTDSELGLAPYWQPDGTVLVLPSYVIADRDGRQWSLIGVADRYVRFVAPDPAAPMPLAAR